jgi:hypothetical protein
VWKYGISRSVFSLLLILPLVAGCTASGYQEFQLYSQAYDAQYMQGDAVLVALGRAERVLFTRRQARDETNQYRFDPDDAAFYVDTVEPPTTASIRTTLKSIKAYNDAMTSLANGDAAQVLTNKVATFVSDTAGAITATAIATSAPELVGGAKAFAAGLKSTLVAVPILKEAATVVSREEFRRQLVAAYPLVDKMLASIRDDGTPIMYLVLTQGRVTRGDVSSHSGISTANQASLDQEKRMLAGWVLLLDQTRVSLKAAKVAAETGSEIDLSNLSNAAVELRVVAEQVKSAQSK